MMQQQRESRRVLSATAIVVLGAAVAAAGWVGGGGRWVAVALFAVFAVGAGVSFLWSARSDHDLAALLGGAGDERQRALDSRATAVAGLVMGAFCVVMALVAIARGEENPWLLVVLVGAVSYTLALVVLRARG
jgi:hypothetical protein